MILPFPRLYLFGGLAVAVLLAGWWVYRSGKEAGKDEQKQESVAETKQQIETLRRNAEAEFQKVSTEAQQAIASARESLRVAESRERGLALALNTLSQSRSESLQSVRQVEDGKLHGAIVQSLALRSPSENTSCFTPSEERKILETLVDYPACQQQTQLQTEQIAEIRNQVTALRGEVKAVEQQAQAEKQLRTRYAEFYTTAYNLLRQKKRSPKCLWLFRCGKEPVLSVPAPENILQPAK